MLAVLASFAIAGFGAYALFTVVLTVRAQAGAVRTLLKEARGVAAEREFRVRILEARALDENLAAGTFVSAGAFTALRRLPRRAAGRRATPQPLRVAA